MIDPTLDDFYDAALDYDAAITTLENALGDSWFLGDEQKIRTGQVIEELIEIRDRIIPMLLSQIAAGNVTAAARLQRVLSATQKIAESEALVLGVDVGLSGFFLQVVNASFSDAKEAAGEAVQKAVPLALLGAAAALLYLIKK